MSFNVGENAGPYRIIEQLGQGGMATVYKAYHASLDRYVALKVLHPAFHQDQTFAARFQREARVVARLEHQNIVPVYDYAEHEGRPFLVMKYIEGDTLKARMSQGPLTAGEIERVVSSVGYALAYAHRQGILHRDIKPSNVMIAFDGSIYLTDFGLARIAEAGESTMSSDSIMGTPQYISPEQAMGKKDLDAGTDIYSFGVMLYEMVVGRVPFNADTPFAIIHDHIYTPLPPPRAVNPNVPESVQRVLLKALAKDRADRYATVEDLIKAFKDAWAESGVPMQGTAIVMQTADVKAAAQQPAPTAPVTATSAPKEEKRISHWVWVSVGALAAAVLILLLLFFNRRGKNQNQVEIPPNPPAPLAQQATAPSSPLLTPQTADPQLQSAIEKVAQNPNDPGVHFDLSLILWERNEKRAALEEMNKAANLAPQNVPDFFIMAGNEYRKRGAWGLALGMYLRLYPIYRNKPMPEDVQENIREAAYNIAGQDEALDSKLLDRMQNLKTPIAAVIRARQALRKGNLSEAKNQINLIKTANPEMYEISLLESELALKEGDTQKAKDLLSALLERPDLSAWARAAAQQSLNSLP